MSLSSPTIVVPGTTASYLRDQYQVPPDTVWSVITKNYERAALHPDDIESKVTNLQRSYEMTLPARIVAGQLYEIAYRELIEELRYNLRDHEDEPVPVYPFGYDWRQPLEIIEDELAAFIDEVIGRTKLMRHYNRADYGKNPKVNLVGHSMGGLIVGGYLSRFGHRADVDKVATLATPFQGSFEAVIKVTTGTADLGTSAPSSREREAARMTPSLYYLLPSFARGLTVDPGLPNNLFDAAVWQPSILETIAEYIRLHSTAKRATKAARMGTARTIFSAMLGAARAHRDRLDKFQLDDAGLKHSDWLCIVGVNTATRIRLSIANRSGQPEFEFQSEHDRDNRWDKHEATEEQRRLTGDGTVPFEGAIPKFFPYNSLVCLRPEDFSYTEVGDKLTASFGGFHGILPNMNVIHRLIVRHFTGRSDRRGNTWSWPAPGAEHQWNPPLSQLE